MQIEAPLTESMQATGVHTWTYLWRYQHHKLDAGAVQKGCMSELLSVRAIAFYGDEIIAVQQHDGAICVLFSHMCENVGQSRVTKTRRVQQHVVLNTGLIELTIQTSGGPQRLLCLRLDLIPLWLASISSTRIKPAFKDKIVRYQTVGSIQATDPRPGAAGKSGGRAGDQPT
jgi:hypothetical protein